MNDPLYLFLYFLNNNIRVDIAQERNGLAEKKAGYACLGIPEVRVEDWSRKRLVLTADPVSIGRNSLRQEAFPPYKD
jgi:hypothetical protein